MTNDKKTSNPFENIFDFYFEQAEKSEPQVKQGIEDWFLLCDKVAEQTLSLQKNLFTSAANKKSTNDNFIQQSKSFAKVIIATQKELALSMADFAFKGLQTLKNTKNT